MTCAHGVAASLCTRRELRPAVDNGPCAHCSDNVARVRALIEQGLKVHDVAELLRVHPKAVEALIG